MTTDERQKRITEATLELMRHPHIVSKSELVECMLDAADKAVPVESKKEADWRLLTKDAEIGQLRHTCKRLDEVLYGATQALRECGLEFDEGLARPIHELCKRAERAEAAAREFVQTLAEIAWPSAMVPLPGRARRIAERVLDAYPSWGP